MNICQGGKDDVAQLRGEAAFGEKKENMVSIGNESLWPIFFPLLENWSAWGGLNEGVLPSLWSAPVSHGRSSQSISSYWVPWRKCKQLHFLIRCKRRFEGEKKLMRSLLNISWSIFKLICHFELFAPASFCPEAETWFLWKEQAVEKKKKEPTVCREAWTSLLFVANCNSFGLRVCLRIFLRRRNWLQKRNRLVQTDVPPGLLDKLTLFAMSHYFPIAFCLWATTFGCKCFFFWVTCRASWRKRKLQRNSRQGSQGVSSEGFH